MRIARTTFILATALVLAGVLVAESKGDLAATFRAECAASAASHQTMSVAGKDGWLFLTAELRHVGLDRFWGDGSNKDPLPAIVDFKQQLEHLGIELIVVPVPPKALVYPDKAGNAVSADQKGAVPRLDTAHQEFYRALAEQKVTVMDLYPALAASRFDEKEGPMFCRTDTHWSGRACVLVAQLIAAEIAKREWCKAIARTQFDSQERTIAIKGDLLDEGASATEDVHLRLVGKKDGQDFSLISSDENSPILLLSDSYGLVFSAGETLFAKGAGLPDQLAFELGFPVDAIGMCGDGVNEVRKQLYRKASKTPAWLSGKKVVVWCFGARQFSESANGWTKMPVKK